MADFQEQIRTTAEHSGGLSAQEKEELRGELLFASLKYNIPGLSETRTEVIGSGDNFASVSETGGNIASLVLGGEEIYMTGQLPYIMPGIGDDGSLQLFPPAYYRYIGHHVVPVANEFLGFDERVHEELERISGQVLPQDYDSGHHGISQCRLGGLNVNEVSPGVTYGVTHSPGRENLFWLQESMDAHFREGWYEETIALRNPNDFPIPVSLLRHPYFVIPASGFKKAEITVVGPGAERSLFRMKDYSSKGEQRFEGIPLLDKGEHLRFYRGDGVVIDIGFEGDYDQEIAGIQLFSNGYSKKSMVADFRAKHKIHQQRLAATARLQEQLGIETEWYSAEALIEEERLHTQMLANVRTICIEDNTSRGNIYGDSDARAVILMPGETKSYTRRTRRVA